MEITIHYKGSSETLEAQKIVTYPKNTKFPTELKIYGADNDEYHNIDAMGLDYDVITGKEEYLIIKGQKIIIDITEDNITKVVFRKWKDTGTIIALFPEELWSRNSYDITCYEHHGQHASADYDAVIRKTTPATEEEYKELLSELKQVGYKNLRVMQKCRPNFKKLRYNN